MKNLGKSLLFGASIAMFWTSCSTDDTQVKTDELKTNVIANYCEVVSATYEDAYSTAIELQTAINTFVSTPTAANLTAAKTAWKAAREPYGQTEAFRFYDGPIDDANGPEGNLNAWPLDEAYVDYTKDNTGSRVDGGIVYDTTNYPTIDATALAGANEAGKEDNISIGYHAIEFLLWGQDDTDVNVNVGQGGSRSYTDFDGSDVFSTRRGQYLKVCAQLIVDDLTAVKAEWTTNGAYRTTFTALSADEAIAKILTGVGKLSDGELAGERIFVALDANAADNPQEHEHSCFSDNTHRDVITNQMSISNVLTGTYTSTAGSTFGNADYSIIALVTLLDADKGAELTTSNATATSKVATMPVPFDKAVTEENVSDNGPVGQAIEALRAQGTKISEAGAVMSLTIDTSV